MKYYFRERYNNRYSKLKDENPNISDLTMHHTAQITKPILSVNVTL